eukprot:TRINITY_DN205_c0_g1_i1.p1 TRINITY_DN205_c0_g1~~TRINITY_DN205_c0_g1_i1.p1  ORF type:complete len:362 (+),score=81.60 TRINITY_DN205_c0_g1_i1:46-1131(+)
MEDIYVVIISFIGCAMSYYVCNHLIEKFAPKFLKSGVYGIDLNKIKPGEDRTDKPKIPESLGTVVGVVYLLTTIILTGITNQEFYHRVEYFASILSITLNLFLGFLDDIVDLSWRHKIFYSFVASIPLLLSWDSSTTILLPTFLDPLQKTSLNISFFYLAYIGGLFMFSTNGINIMAGVNGLEVGESLAIALGCLLHNAIKLTNESEHDNALFSILVLLPFVFCCIPLYNKNKFPAKVFVGDSFTYFAGTVLAVAGILGHFSKSLFVMLVPQLFNYLYSLPQLLGFIPCPRHRLPTVREDGLLEGDKDKWNVVNLVLRIFGPMTEERLCRIIVNFQIVWCLFVVILRNIIAQFHWLYPETV